MGSSSTKIQRVVVVEAGHSTSTNDATLEDYEGENHDETSPSGIDGNRKSDARGRLTETTGKSNTKSIPNQTNPKPNLRNSTRTNTSSRFLGRKNSTTTIVSDQSYTSKKSTATIVSGTSNASEKSTATIVSGTSIASEKSTATIVSGTSNASKNSTATIVSGVSRVTNEDIMTSVDTQSFGSEDSILSKHEDDTNCKRKVKPFMYCMFVAKYPLLAYCKYPPSPPVISNI